MSRFKELTRIEAAIKSKNKPDLEWADSYCAMRLRLAIRKDHQKHWRDLRKRVADAAKDSN